MQTVCFGLAIEYDNGRHTGVAMNGDTVIEVHKSEKSDDLWYIVGTTEFDHVNWGKSHKYDTGVGPAVAFAGARIVEVHQSENRPRLFYRTGSLKDEKQIAWTVAESFVDGEQPCVAMNASGVVVEMHATRNGAKQYELWYSSGHIEGDGVRWRTSQLHNIGVNPAVALFDDGRVVEMHKSQDSQELFISSGVVNADGTIQWTEPLHYTGGRAPAIACERGSNRLVNVHEHTGDPNRLVSATGTLDGSAINWSEPLTFDRGWNPAVAYSGRIAVHTHSGNDRENLWSSLSLVEDRVRWMGERREVLNSRKFWQLTLPATHDSGAFRSTEAEWNKRVPATCRHLDLPAPHEAIEPLAIAQSRDMGGQLSHGVRYFDLRLIPDGDDFRAFHDLIGPPLSTMLDQLATFLKDVECELVILKFSHFCEFQNADHKRLIEKIQEKIGAYLLKFDTTPEVLLKMTFAELTAHGPLVVIDYRDDYVSDRKNPTNGFLRHLPTYDETSKKDNLSDMAEDQLKKLKENEGNENQLFLLSWTLTPHAKTVISGDLSLHQLSKSANRQLGTFCRKYAPKYLINLLYVDFFEDARATDLAILING